jgi:hypothetical protein
MVKVIQAEGRDKPDGPLTIVSLYLRFAEPLGHQGSYDGRGGKNEEYDDCKLRRCELLINALPKAFLLHFQSAFRWFFVM